MVILYIIMQMFYLIGILSILSIVNGQNCRGKFNDTIRGQCSNVDNCQGTILATNSCPQKQCCINGTVKASPKQCLTLNDFDISYNHTSRAVFLRKILNYGIDSAGICDNCQAKAAFLAIAATMTNNFQMDEVTFSNTIFARDDTKYGNTQAGDGSRFRQRGFFGLRGREMYTRLQTLKPQYQSLTNPESVALTQNAIDIASLLWNNPNLQSQKSNLTQYADGTFYSFSMLWYKLTGGIEQLSQGAKYYSKFLRQLKCGGDLYPGQGPICQYNATHKGVCSADCIKGLEDAGEFCGCADGKGQQCPNSPVHIRCCMSTCSQELKMDLGFVLDASGSIRVHNYELQRNFTKNLLQQVNVGRNKTHVGIINYSSQDEVLTWLNTDYNLNEKLQRVNQARYFNQGTNTAKALQTANSVFSYANGRRQPKEGASQVIFVVTDGESDNPVATIQAAAVLKKNGITLVSVGVGNGPNLTELHAICTPPVSENYFSISDYDALDQKLNQFTSKSCSESVTIPANTTTTGEIGKDKYKFLKIKIILIGGNKIMIRIKLLNGKVKLFHSFVSRNPKDPEDFLDYEIISSEKSLSKNTKVEDTKSTTIIEKPNSNVEYVYLGLKGLENDNKFEVTFDDCNEVDCNLKGTSSNIKISVITLTFCFISFVIFF